jgi:hypothetical protein
MLSKHHSIQRATCIDYFRSTGAANHLVRKIEASENQK